MTLKNLFAPILFGEAAHSLDREIDEEIQFHLDCRIEELIAGGASRQQAQQTALQEFGSRNKVKRDCQNVRYGRTFWLIQVAAAVFLISLAGTGLLVYSAGQLQGSNAQLREQLDAALAEIPRTNLVAVAQPKTTQEKPSLAGTVLNDKKQPVAGAKVELILKTWPNNRYRQQRLQTKTDAQGRYEFKDLYSLHQQVAVLVTVLADGYAMESHYVLEEAPTEAIADIDFSLPIAQKKTFQILSEGKPVANAAVFPFHRTTADGTEHLTYWMSQPEISQKTDDQGRVTLSYFLPGEQVKLGILQDEPVTYALEVDDQLVQRLELMDDPDAITGSVVDKEGLPISKATALVVWKQWNPGYQQSGLSEEVDMQGNFRLTGLYQPDSRYGISLTMYAPGYELCSSYLFDPTGSSKPEYKIELAPAQSKKLTFLDKQGKPLSNVTVIPRKRVTSDGTEHVFYHMVSKPTQRLTSEEGSVDLSLFLAGDTVELTLMSGEKTLATANVKLDDQETQTVKVGDLP